MRAHVSGAKTHLFYVIFRTQVKNKIARCDRFVSKKEIRTGDVIT